MGLFDRLYENNTTTQQSSEAERREKRALAQEARIAQERRQALYEQELLSRIQELSTQNSGMAETIRNLTNQVEILKVKAMEAADREVAREMRQQEEDRGLAAALDMAVEELRAEHEATKEAVANTTLEVKSDVLSMADQLSAMASELRESSVENQQAILNEILNIVRSGSDHREMMEEVVSSNAGREREALIDAFSDLSEKNRASLEETFTALSRSNRTGIEQTFSEISEANRGAIEKRIADVTAESAAGIRDHLEGSTESMRQHFDDSHKDMKSELSERIHDESVKNYRNMQAMVEDEIGKLKDSALNEKSMKQIKDSFRGLKIFSGITFAGVVVIVIIVIWYLMSLA